MVRSAIVALLLGVACAAADDEKDPVKEKLFAAKVAYDKDMAAFRRAAGEWFDGREEKARSAGDKKALEAVKADRKAFDEDGLLPKTAPAAVQQIPVVARKAIETVYAQAVKDYIKAKKDDEAAAIEKELSAFLLAARGSVDLLSLVDTKAHATSGDWKKDEKALVGASTDKGSQLQIPYTPGEEYDLDLTCRRTQGDDCVGLGLVAGGRQVMIFVDAYPSRGFETGFKVIDNKQVSTYKGGLLKVGKDTPITCSVRAGKIDLFVGGKAITAFKGDFTRLSYPEPTPNAKALFLIVNGTNCSFQFDRIVVTPVKGKGTILK